jgi:hypothetical protein
MYEVVWVESAVVRLAAAWTNADSMKRAAITAASHRIDEVLRVNPIEAGESRDQGRRVYIDLPLVVTYEVDVGQQIVTVVESLVSGR